MPSAVTTRGSQRNELPEHWHSLYGFTDSEVAVQSTGGVINQPGRPFLHGFAIQLERATLVFELAVMNNAEYQKACKPHSILALPGSPKFDC